MAFTPTIDALTGQGWYIERGVGLDPDNAALLVLGQRFGATSWQGIKPGAPNLEKEGVNRVEAMDLPMHDAVGQPVLSTNADEFPLHTDDSYNPDPARWVFMHCWQPDEDGGGESWVSLADDFVALAPPELTARLLATPYPTPFGYAKVLTRSLQGNWHVRFNRRDMMGFSCVRSEPLSQQQLLDLETLEKLAMNCVKRVHLAAGDCIVVDNHRVLHGRSAFNPNSKRLFKRLRIL